MLSSSIFSHLHPDGPFQGQWFLPYISKLLPIFLLLVYFTLVLCISNHLYPFYLHFSPFSLTHLPSSLLLYFFLTSALSITVTSYCYCFLLVRPQPNPSSLHLSYLSHDLLTRILWGWRQHIPPKLRQLSNKLLGVVPQKQQTLLFSFMWSFVVGITFYRRNLTG
jgi:hypothetical protein